MIGIFNASKAIMINEGLLFLSDNKRDIEDKAFKLIES